MSVAGSGQGTANTAPESNMIIEMKGITMARSSWREAMAGGSPARSSEKGLCMQLCLFEDAYPYVYVQDREKEKE